jgi:lipoprotein-releasing system permease protein
MDGHLFFLAKKFLGKRHQESFIWFITLISIIGITLGVASLMITLGVMNGFTNDLKSKIIGASPNIIVEGSPYIFNYHEIANNLKKNFPEITDIGYFTQTQVIYRSSKYMIGGDLKGISYQNSSEEIGRFIKKGSANLKNGIVIGSQLAKQLGVSVGDTITVVSGFPPIQISYKIVGIIEYGVYNVDVSLGLISLSNFQQDFLNGEKLAAIGIKVKDFYNSNKIAKKMSKVLPPYCRTTTWIQRNKVLFSALALEKKAMILILAIIILIASFNIASSLMMTVYRKIKEIGVLKTIGLTSWEIRKVFIYQGLIIGIRGLIFGLILGGAVIYVVKQYKIVKLPQFIYNISYLPLEISVKDIIIICIAVILMTLLASLFPAYKAGKMEPAIAIRYE